MIEATGNLWTYPADVICVTTNGIVNRAGRAVMGAGTALEAKKRFPGIDARLGSLLNQYGNRAMKLHKYSNSERSVWIVSYPTKNDWHEDSDLGLIRASAGQLVDMANKFGWHSIVLPRPGCGNGHLEWSTVKDIIAPILDDRFTVLTPPERKP